MKTDIRVTILWATELRDGFGVSGPAKPPNWGITSKHWARGPPLSGDLTQRLDYVIVWGSSPLGTLGSLILVLHTALLGPHGLEGGISSPSLLPLYALHPRVLQST